MGQLNAYVGSTTGSGGQAVCCQGSPSTCEGAESGRE